MQQTEEMEEATESQPSAAEPEDKSNKTLLSSIAIVLILVSSVLLFNSFGTYYKGLVALQYSVTDATVTKAEEHFDPFGVRKEIQLSFQLDKVEKHAVVEMPQGRVMKPGEVTLLFYDPNNPSNAVLSKEIDYDSIVVFGAFGMFAFCFGALIASKVLLRH